MPILQCYFNSRIHSQILIPRVLRANILSCLHCTEFPAQCTWCFFFYHRFQVHDQMMITCFSFIPKRNFSNLPGMWWRPDCFDINPKLRTATWNWACGLIFWFVTLEYTEGFERAMKRLRTNCCRETEDAKLGDWNLAPLPWSRWGRNKERARGLLYTAPGFGDMAHFCPPGMSPRHHMVLSWASGGSAIRCNRNAH